MLIKDPQSTISEYFTNFNIINKNVLYLLFEKKIVRPDSSFNTFFRKIQYKMPDLYYFLYPSIKSYLSESVQMKAERDISVYFNEEIETFEKKCQIGENDSYICSLIRKDSIDEFIIYVNQKCISLNSKINFSFFETNSYLINKSTTLIEYAAFFGSIQIFQYLRLNNVQLTPSLWGYAIHSNNGEIIHILESNEIKPIKLDDEEDPYESILKESILCHHNDVANYINNNLLKQFKDEIEFCDSYQKIIFDTCNYYFLPNKIDRILSREFNGIKMPLAKLLFSIKTITIPDSITSIKNSFCGCFSIEKVIIPSSLTLIEDKAFKGCVSLKQIIIPSSVTSIGKKAFYKCSSLTEITIPSSSLIESIGELAFYGCTSLVQFTIPKYVESIGPSAFYGCTSLKHVKIPNSVKKIGNYAFYECSSLKQITIPSSVENNKSNIFTRCSSLPK